MLRLARAGSRGGPGVGRAAAAAAAAAAFGISRALAESAPPAPDEACAVKQDTPVDPHAQYRKLPPASEMGNTDAGHFACFDGRGRRCCMEDVLRAAAASEVVVVGETHDDPVAHQLQVYMLMALQQSRQCVLSLEMFETDVQHVLDEYTAGLIREADMPIFRCLWPSRCCRTSDCAWRASS